MVGSGARPARGDLATNAKRWVSVALPHANSMDGTIDTKPLQAMTQFTDILPCEQPSHGS